MRFLLVRDGSLMLDIGRAKPSFAKPSFAKPGDAVPVAAGAQFGYRSEGEVISTTLLIDTDYLIEHLFWQHLDLIPDRDAARELAAKLYPEPVQGNRGGLGVSD